MEICDQFADRNDEAAQAAMRMAVEADAAAKTAAAAYEYANRAADRYEKGLLSLAGMQKIADQAAEADAHATGAAAEALRFASLAADDLTTGFASLELAQQAAADTAAGLEHGEAMVAAALGLSASAAERLRDVDLELAAADEMVRASEAALAESAALRTATTLASIDATLALARTDKILAGADEVLAAGFGTVAVYADKAAAAAGAAGGRWFGLLGWLRGASVPLFGGAATITGLHLLVDWAAEFLAVIIPATVAVLAFGAAAYKTFDQVVMHLQAVHTVMTATGAVIPPFTSAFAQLQNAVRPDVMQLYGDAIDLVRNKMGELSIVAQGAGHVLDAFAARATVALESGGFSQFMRNAVTDLAGLLNVAGNVFGTIGNLLRTLPGYAQPILVAFEAVSRALEAITGSGAVQGLLRLGLALHGLWIYTGLAVTAVLALRGPLTALAGWIGAGIGQIALLGTAFMSVARAEGIVTAASLLLERVSPWGWVALGIGALAGLIVMLHNTKSATQSWLDSLQASLDKASMFAGINQLFADLGKVTNTLGAAQQHLAGYTRDMSQQFVTGGHAVLVLGDGIQSAQQRLTQLAAGQQQFLGEATTATGRLGALAGTYGGLRQATMLAALAGIRFSQVLHDGRQQWLADQQQIAALVTGYRQMGQAGTLLAGDVNAVTYAASDQLAAMQKVNQAWDTFTANVAAPRADFTSFAQSIVQFAHDAPQAGAAVVAMARQVTTGTLQLRSDFQQSYTSAVQLFDAMRTAGTPGAQFTATVKAAVAVLLPLAGASKGALAQVSALAQEAAGPATTSARALATWTGKIHDPMLALQASTDKAAISISNLSLDAQRLSTTLQQDLNSMMAQAILNATGVQGAMERYTSAVLHNTLATQAGQGARKGLYDDLMTVTHNAAETNSIMATLTRTVSGTTTQVWDLVHAIANLHSKSITITTYLPVVGLGSRGGHTGTGPIGAAAGGVVPGPDLGRDSQLIWARGGEGILVPEAVSMLGGSGAIHALNRMAESGAMHALHHMAAGGIVPVPAPVLAPAWGGGGSGGYGGGPMVIHNHVTVVLDGKVISRSTQTETLRRAHRNISNGLRLPGR